MAQMGDRPTWGSVGKSQFDFRTDSHTVPSLFMLEALLKTTLDDDVFREDEITIRFEADMAAMTGMQDGCITWSGTMANQIALRVLLAQPPYAILTDSRAHIIHFEAGGTSYLTGAMVQAVKPSNNLYLTLNDIRSKAIVTDDVQKTPTKVISIECATHGAITPLPEMRRISAWAREKDIRLHLDGARLFEAVAAGAGSLRDYCMLFDTVYLDFSKNLGSPLGTMVLGSNSLITQARRVRKAFGGGVRPTGIVSSLARAAVEQNFGWSGRGDKADALRHSHSMAKLLGETWKEMGGTLTRPVETNIVWLDIKRHGYNAARWDGLGADKGVILDGPRLVVHHQISEEAIRRMLEVFREVTKPSVGPLIGRALL